MWLLLCGSKERKRGTGFVRTPQKSLKNLECVTIEGTSLSESSVAAGRSPSFSSYAVKVVKVVVVQSSEMKM